MRTTIIIFALTLVAALSAASAEKQSPKPPVPITRDQVCSAIRDALRKSPLETLEFKNDQIDIPDVRAKSGSAQLQATSVSYDPKNNLLESRLKCTRSGCVPFYARVIATTSTKPLARQSLLISTRRDIPNHPSPVLLKPGQSATLAIVTPAIRISLPVQCLQSGALGQTVRVRDPQTKKVFLARIESTTKLAFVGGPQ